MGRPPIGKRANDLERTVAQVPRRSGRNSHHLSITSRGRRACVCLVRRWSLSREAVIARGDDP
jgi:hypothetical protein